MSYLGNRGIVLFGKSEGTDQLHVTAQLMWAFVFAYMHKAGSLDAAQIFSIFYK